MKKKGNINICYKLNKEFSTDGVTLSVEAKPQFFDEWHFVNEVHSFFFIRIYFTRISRLKFAKF